MSTPDTTPEQPEPPKYGQRLPEAGAQPGQPGGQPQYGQQAQPQYGQWPSNQPGQNPPQYGQPYGQAPQAPYGQAPYGFQSPQPGLYPPGKTVPARRPLQLTIAAVLIFVAGGIMALLGVMIMLIPAPVLEDGLNQAIAADPSVRAQLEASGLTVAALVDMAKGVAAVVFLVAAALYVLVGVFVMKGSNGARITATVLAVLSVFAYFGGGPGGWLLIALGVAAVVLTWLQPASDYINAKRAGAYRA